MSPQLILVHGPSAKACANALAAGGGHIISAASFPEEALYFRPLIDCYIYARERAELSPWMKQAAGLLHAHNNSTATVLQGRVRGRRRGNEIAWGTKS